MAAQSKLDSDRFRLPAAAERRSRKLAEERFLAYLADHNLKFTQERRAILQEFYRIHKHIEADELFFHLHRAGVRVSRATIYRTLDLLVHAGLARRVSFGKDHAYYENILGREAHEHFVCLGCDRVIEWLDPDLLRLLARNCDERRFAPARHSLLVFGYCEDCVNSHEAQAALRQMEDVSLLDD
ncbi:MAG: Fur family transcriptional regulator [Acidobacteriota bacterium]